MSDLHNLVASNYSTFRPLADEFKVLKDDMNACVHCSNPAEFEECLADLQTLISKVKAHDERLTGEYLIEFYELDASYNEDFLLKESWADVYEPSDY